jgi:hypothetical protein
VIGRLVGGHVVWRPPRAEESPEHCIAHTQHFEHDLRQLALRWLKRNLDLRDSS